MFGLKTSRKNVIQTNLTKWFPQERCLKVGKMGPPLHKQQMSESKGRDWIEVACDVILSPKLTTIHHSSLIIRMFAWTGGFFKLHRLIWRRKLEKVTEICSLKVLKRNQSNLFTPCCLFCCYSSSCCSCWSHMLFTWVSCRWTWNIYLFGK